MARIPHRLIAALVCLAPLVSGGAAAAADSAPTSGGVQVTLVTRTQGNTEWDHLEAQRNGGFGSASIPIPTRRGAYCYWSQWHLVKVQPSTRARQYAIYIWNACGNGEQVIPSNADQSCANGDSQFASALPSTCVTEQPGHIPVGIPPDECNAAADASVALNAGLSPATYDPSQPATLTATTSFASDFLQRLDEGTCTDVLTWRTLGWTLTWPDGHVDQLPASGQNGVTASHTMTPAPGPSATATSDVTAVAHLLISGTAQDFDAGGNIITVPRTALVDISNKASAITATGPPVYTAPKLATGAIGAVENGDGSMPPPNLAATASTHLDTIYGRLLDIYPRAIVLAPGTESVGGVVVGTSSTTTTTWRYAGGPTDAPAASGTPPGAGGTPGQPIVVQYNHAERLDPLGHPVDERVPITITATTTFPDGHTITQTFAGSVAVTIYYVGLNNS